MDLGISSSSSSTRLLFTLPIDNKPNKFSDYFQVLHSDITVLLDFILVHLESLAFICHRCFVNSSDQHETEEGNRFRCLSACNPSRALMYFAPKNIQSVCAHPRQLGAHTLGSAQACIAPLPLTRRDLWKYFLASARRGARSLLASACYVWMYADVCM